jgi:hypothetical protein
VLCDLLAQKLLVTLKILLKVFPKLLAFLTAFGVFMVLAKSPQSVQRLGELLNQIMIDIFHMPRSIPASRRTQKQEKNFLLFSIFAKRV